MPSVDGVDRRQRQRLLLCLSHLQGGRQHCEQEVGACCAPSCLCAQPQPCLPTRCPDALATPLVPAPVSLQPVDRPRPPQRHLHPAAPRLRADRCACCCCACCLLVYGAAALARGGASFSSSAPLHLPAADMTGGNGLIDRDTSVKGAPAAAVWAWLLLGLTFWGRMRTRRGLCGPARLNVRSLRLCSPSLPTGQA